MGLASSCFPLLAEFTPCERNPKEDFHTHLWGSQRLQEPVGQESKGCSPYTISQWRQYEVRLFVHIPLYAGFDKGLLPQIVLCSYFFKI